MPVPPRLRGGEDEDRLGTRCTLSTISAAALCLSAGGDADQQSLDLLQDGYDLLALQELSCSAENKTVRSSPATEAVTA